MKFSPPSLATFPITQFLLDLLGLSYVQIPFMVREFSMLSAALLVCRGRKLCKGENEGAENFKGIKYISIASFPLWLLALWRVPPQVATPPPGRAAKRP
ncbi:hypothetical protein Y032_0439g1497 [Ancylostoma ceylanicum]|uniref:Uncharacterized protein n=1 Tax=Ancylostoma ceylanicum TaxID=53326 RepID=A0A016WZM0_9BILA|nr:hypothetical protein Y032_0439g1497 [Ancylostoma ceylanicum]